MVRHLFRPADRAEEDGVVRADLAFPILGHHAAVLEVVVAGGEVEPILLQREAETSGRRFESPHPLRNDFDADAVAGYDRDAVGSIIGHGLLLAAERSLLEEMAGRV